MCQMNRVELDSNKINCFEKIFKIMLVMWFNKIKHNKHTVT